MKQTRCKLLTYLVVFQAPSWARSRFAKAQAVPKSQTLARWFQQQVVIIRLKWGRLRSNVNPCNVPILGALILRQALAAWTTLTKLQLQQISSSRNLISSILIRWQSCSCFKKDAISSALNIIQVSQIISDLQHAIGTWITETIYKGESWQVLTTRWPSPNPSPPLNTQKTVKPTGKPNYHVNFR